MPPHSADSSGEVEDHGGSLGRAARRYPDAPRPWLDLSTGINARPYRMPRLPPEAFERLPEDAELCDLADVAARAYGAPSGECVVCAPGTQILLPLVAGLVPKGRAAVLSPTYAEHRRAAVLAGHAVEETATLAGLGGADLAVLVNPNNPDGRVIGRAELLALAGTLGRHGGLLVVDEAFMDAGPPGAALDADVGVGNVVVLRSFGKFFGLAGLRLGFAICDADMARRLRARLGPWAVSGPALRAGLAGLADLGWQERMRADLTRRAARLDAILAGAGLTIRGGTGLFRFAGHPDAPGLAALLGRAGILVRSFSFDATALRFGIPGDERAFDRLEKALVGQGIGR